MEPEEKKSDGIEPWQAILLIALGLGGAWAVFQRERSPAVEGEAVTEPAPALSSERAHAICADSFRSVLGRAEDVQLPQVGPRLDGGVWRFTWDESGQPIRVRVQGNELTTSGHCAIDGGTGFVLAMSIHNEQVKLRAVGAR